MSNTTDNQDTPQDSLVIPSELDSLKSRADKMGLSYHPNIGLDKLKHKVNNALNADSDTETTDDSMDESDTDTPVAAKEAANVPHKPVVKAETVGERNARLKRDASRLIRVRVACMNPNKKSWEGELFTLSNSVVGTHKKFVPFNIEEGFHIPNIIYKAMRERKCQIFVPDKHIKGKRIAKQISEFNIEVMNPLTQDELQDLAQKQAMAGSID